MEIGPNVLDPQAAVSEQVFLSRHAGTLFQGGLDRFQAGRVLKELKVGAHGILGGGASAHVEGDNRAEALSESFQSGVRSPLPCALRW
jgi:hypothetical protein